jgi:hypothetical protein
MLAHGFTADMLAGLVLVDLAMPETGKAGSRTTKVIRMRITAAGREALAAEG